MIRISGKRRAETTKSRVGKVTVYERIMKVVRPFGRRSRYVLVRNIRLGRDCGLSLSLIRSFTGCADC